jgi:hypothetical protein
MSYDESVEESRARFVERNLRRFSRAVQAGRFEAIGDALAFCARWGAPIPRWLEGVRRLPPPKRGRGRPPADETDFVRWDMVQECRDRRGDEHIPTTWDKTFEAVSEKLRGTPHAGNPETVRASYKRVLKRSRITPGRYYIKDIG